MLVSTFTEYVSRIAFHLLKVDVIGELHVLVNAKDLETASKVGDTDVDFPIEATKATETGQWS